MADLASVKASVMTNGLKERTGLWSQRYPCQRPKEVGKEVVLFCKANGERFYYRKVSAPNFF
jgi:hypothetical protein